MKQHDDRRRLEPDKLPFPLDGVEREWAIAIAQETEAERERCKTELLQGEEHPELRSVGKVIAHAYWDHRRWDHLLPVCIGRCTVRTGLSRLELVTFAHEKCFPADPEVLYWYREYLRKAIEAASDLASAESDARREMQQRAAAGMHRENRAMKTQVHEWLDRNAANFTTLEAMAEAIDGARLVPVSRVTVRKWVGDWKKLRQSRRKPD